MNGLAAFPNTIPTKTLEIGLTGRELISVSGTVYVPTSHTVSQPFGV